MPGVSLASLIRKAVTRICCLLSHMQTCILLSAILQRHDILKKGGNINLFFRTKKKE